MRFGSGPELFVGIHGWGGSLETFRPFAPLVPAWASLYAVDLPGYGGSPRPPSFTGEAIAGALVEDVDRLGADRVTLIGNCSGAIFALLTGPRLRTPVRRYVLIDPFAFLPWYFKVFVHPVYGRAAYMSTFANPIGRWLTNVSLRARRTDESNLTRSFTGVDHEASQAYLAALNRLEGIARFGGIRAPIDIAHGERTFAAVRASVAQWTALWPQARVFPLPGAGHLPIEEATAALARFVFADEDLPDVRG